MLRKAGEADEQRVPWQRAWPLFKRFWPFMHAERRVMLGIAALLVLAVPAGVFSPLLIKRLFDEAIPQRDFGLLVRFAAAIIGLTLGAHALRFTAGLVTRAQNRIKHRLAKTLYEHVMRLPMRYFHTTETGYVMARVREDVDSLNAVTLDSLIHGIIDLARAVLFFGLLLAIDLPLAGSGLLLLLLIFVGVVAVSRPLRIRSETAQEADANFSSALHQSISGIATVRLSAMRRGEGRRLSAALKAAVRAVASRDILHVWVSYTVGLAVALGMYVILIIGAGLIIRGRSTFGTLMAFSIYLTYVAGAVSSVLSLNPAMQRALASLARIFRVFDEPVEADGPAPTQPLQLRGRVTFDRVSFAYLPDTPALLDVSLEVAPGEVLAIVGRSGAGKSTLVQLIPRLFDPSAGEIRIDGRPLRELPLTALRRQIGVVPQEVFLFNRSVRDNIAYATPHASDAQIEAAAQAAHAHEFIARLDQGYATLVGERGVKLSGGEKQRIAIAREILRDPPILILDEATSSLDSESEALIKDAVDRLKQNRTCFVIAHRLSTVVGADRIAVLDRGRLIESGSHAELIAAGGVYRRLYETQFQ